MVLERGVRVGGDVCAMVSSASFGTASTVFPLSCSTTSSLPCSLVDNDSTAA